MRVFRERVYSRPKGGISGLRVASIFLKDRGLYSNSWLNHNKKLTNQI